MYTRSDARTIVDAMFVCMNFTVAITAIHTDTRSVKCRLHGVHHRYHSGIHEKFQDFPGAIFSGRFVVTEQQLNLKTRSSC